MLLDSDLNAKIADFGQAVFEAKGYVKKPAQYVDDQIYVEISKRDKDPKFSFKGWLDVSFFGIVMGQILLYGSLLQQFSMGGGSGEKDPFKAFILRLPKETFLLYLEVIQNCFSGAVKTFDQVYLMLKASFKELLKNPSFLSKPEDVEYVVQTLEPRKNLSLSKDTLLQLSNCRKYVPEIERQILEMFVFFVDFGREQWLGWVIDYWIKSGQRTERLVQAMEKMLDQHSQNVDNLNRLLICFKALKNYLRTPKLSGETIKKLVGLMNHNSLQIQRSVLVIYKWFNVLFANNLFVLGLS